MSGDVFGMGGGDELALQLGLPLLGRIRLDPELRVWGDRGEPLVSAEPESDSAREITRIAEELVSLKRERGVGMLERDRGHRFGFELTFFRQAVARDPVHPTAWAVEDLYLAHLALSDLTAGHFYLVERTNRIGPGIAGVDEAAQRIWNGNWQIQWEGSDQKLQAIEKQFQLHLTLHPEKPPVIHGENGVSQKSQGAGYASYYISLTRLTANGQLNLNGAQFEVSGLAWMDHEYFTEAPDSTLDGWDWFAIQLDNNEELMLYRLRRNSAAQDRYSSGTYVDSQGHAHFLDSSQFSLSPGGLWRSPHSQARYPLAWQITVPSPVAVGAPANPCMVDPAARWTVRGTELASRSRNTPFEGRTLPGQVLATFLRGAGGGA